MCGENHPDCGCAPGKVGNPVVVWPNWITNQARNNGADIWPTPFVPRRHGNVAFAETGMIQLNNGWSGTNFGKRMDYDNYLRLLTTSSAGPGKNEVLPGKQPVSYRQVSQDQLQTMQSAMANPPNGGGTGVLAPNVDLSGRTYYG